MLTAREMQALSLIARGFTDGEIAALLAISSSTARKHRENVQRKLSLRKASQLTIYYLLHHGERGKKNSRQCQARPSVRAKGKSSCCLPTA